MTTSHPEPWHALEGTSYDYSQLETFMQTFSYALGLAEAGDPAAGQRLLQNHLEELRHSPDAPPAGLLELWEIGLVRYENRFQALRVRTTKSPEGG